MATSTRYPGKARSVPAGLAIGACVSVFTTAVFTAGIAFGLNDEKITWTQAGYWIMGMLYLASFLGAKTTYKAIKRQRLAVSILSGLLYLGLLLCITALFFGGDYEGVGVTGGLIGAGSGTAALITGQKSKQSRKKH